MEQLTETSSVLFSKLPQIQNLAEMIELSCSLLHASAYIVDASGHILTHSNPKNVACESWLYAVSVGQLSEAHRKTVLTPTINCNVIRDQTCQGDPCARLSIPISIAGQMLPGAVVFFLWDNDPTIQKQTIASILAGAISSLLQKNGEERVGIHEASLRLLKDLLNYKPGLNLYFTNALNTSEFSEINASYHLCVLVSEDDSSFVSPSLLEKTSMLSEHIWVFEQNSQILCLFRSNDFSPAEFSDLILPVQDEFHLQACCSIQFNDLLKLRFLYEDVLLAYEIAKSRDPDTNFYYCENYLSFVFLSRCKQKMNVRDSFPLFFRRLIEHDERTGKNYIQTLSTYLDCGRNTNAAAKQSFMHRNTMVQQLERIEQITGISLEDSEMCFFLQLCIRMYDN